MHDNLSQWLLNRLLKQALQEPLTSQLVFVLNRTVSCDWIDIEALYLDLISLFQNVFEIML